MSEEGGSGWINGDRLRVGSGFILFGCWLASDDLVGSVRIGGFVLL